MPPTLICTRFSGIDPPRDPLVFTRISSSIETVSVGGDRRPPRRSILPACARDTRRYGFQLRCESRRETRGRTDDGWLTGLPWKDSV